MGEPQSEREKAKAPDSPEPIDEGEVLEWTCHPVKRRPVVSVAVTAFIFLVTAGVYYSTYSKWFALIAAVVLLASLAKFYFPTRFRLSDRQIKVKTTTQTIVKDWSLFRSSYADKNGILLSPFVAPSRLENFRGLYLMYDDNKDEVVAFVKERIKREHQKREAAKDTGAATPTEGEKRQ